MPQAREDSNSPIRSVAKTPSGKKHSSPCYLYLKGNIYYFRYRFSASEREHLQHAEIRVSLRTGFLHEARKKAGYLRASLEEFMGKKKDGSYQEAKAHLAAKLRELMDSCPEKNPPSIATIRQRMDVLRQRMLDETDSWLCPPEKNPDFDARVRQEIVDEMTSVFGYPPFSLKQTCDTSPDLAPPVSLEHRFKEYQPDIADSPQKLWKAYYPTLLLDLIDEKLFSPDELTHESILQILNEFHKVRASLYRIMQVREQGDYAYERNFQPTPATRDVKAQPIDNDEPPSPTLNETIEAYCAEKQRAGAWTERTANDFIPKLQFFGKQIGDIQISALNRRHIRAFKDIVDKLPSGYGRDKTFRDVPLEKIREGIVPVDKRMSATSLSKYYGIINTFIIWLQNKYDDVTSGIEKIMSISVTNQKDLLRNIFAREDLQKIFTSEEYKKKTFNADYKYWVPLIGYYTGMRLEEICQLYLTDIKQEGNIWYFDIVGDRDKHVKTASGIRKVPVHPDLIDKFAFLDFVNAQRNKNCERLFQELKKQSGRYSHYVSRWFNQYLRKVGVKDDGTGKVFHSFRHTFINNCKLAGIEEYKVKEVVGHDVGSKSITYGRYGKKYPLDILYQDVIMKVPSLMGLFSENA